jgi:hypothetical protein
MAPRVACQSLGWLESEAAVSGGLGTKTHEDQFPPAKRPCGDTAMRAVAGWLSCLLTLTEAVWCGEHAAGQAKDVPPAGIEGRVTVVLSVRRATETHPVGNLTVYLFKLEQSRPLQELQRKCRGALAQPRLDAIGAYNTCQKCLAEAVELVPRLSYAATTRTSHEGLYRFDHVPPAQRYQVVAVRTEDEEHIVIVGLTPKLRPGQRVTLDLSENEPWTDAIPGKD